MLKVCGQAGMGGGWGSSVLTQVNGFLLNRWFISTSCFDEALPAVLDATRSETKNGSESMLNTRWLVRARAELLLPLYVPSTCT